MLLHPWVGSGSPLAPQLLLELSSVRPRCAAMPEWRPKASLERQHLTRRQLHWQMHPRQQRGRYWTLLMLLLSVSLATGMPLARL